MKVVLEALKVAVHELIATGYQRPKPPEGDGRWLVGDKQYRSLVRTLAWADRQAGDPEAQ